MAEELEELVGFLHDVNPEIRKIAIENLVGYSTVKPSIFHVAELRPIEDLKTLVKDPASTAKNALTILINLTATGDSKVLRFCAGDSQFFECLMSKITLIEYHMKDKKEPNANEIGMLLANLSKSDHALQLLKMKRPPVPSLSESTMAIDHLLDCFVKGAQGSYNPNTDFDYLAYFFGELAKFEDCRKYFTTPQAHDSNIIPLSKLTPFTVPPHSLIRRQGVASTLKNTAFHIPSHTTTLLPSTSSGGINILPYLLLPLMGSEDYDVEEMEKLPEEVQLLEPDKEREPDVGVLTTHLETLLLLATTKEGRQTLKDRGVYPVVRECHANVEDERVRESCDRWVQVVMRDEEARDEGENGVGTVEEIGDPGSDEDEKVVDVF
ncbi:MAG: hypothetical protein M1831_007362 [Alyxoria varia]|nr:MAG: hypothetical protein M1831_007362 [Alyxoria varia]